jgi:hypothetical protein
VTLFVKYYAASALKNIAAGTSDHTKLVIDLGAVPILVNLLTSPSHDVRNQVYLFSSRTGIFLFFIFLFLLNTKTLKLYCRLCWHWETFPLIPLVAAILFSVMVP